MSPTEKALEDYFDRLTRMELVRLYEYPWYGLYCSRNKQMHNDKIFAVYNGFQKQLTTGRYTTYTEALKEAERLSAQFTGIDFFVMEAKAKVRTESPTKVTVL